MAATVDMTGRRPLAGIPRIGTAATSALSTVPVVGAGAHGATARINRPPASKVGAGIAGVVVMPLIGSSTVMSRPGTVTTRIRIPVSFGVGRLGGAATPHKPAPEPAVPQGALPLRPLWARGSPARKWALLTWGKRLSRPGYLARQRPGTWDRRTRAEQGRHAPCRRDAPSTRGTRPTRLRPL